MDSQDYLFGFQQQINDLTSENQYLNQDVNNFPIDIIKYQSNKEDEDVETNLSSKNNTSSKQLDQLQLMKVCKVQNIDQFIKQPQDQNLFLMYGDLLIETNRLYDDVDYTLKVCSTYLKKKRVVEVNYDKINHLIEMKSENKFSGQKDFSYIQALLSKTSNNRNYQLAQILDKYQQKMLHIDLQYQKFFEENDEELVLQIQQDFFDKMKQEFLDNIAANENDFYSYLFYTYIDKLDRGFPIQKQQGVNEATCALFGCDASQLVELMTRYGFIEQIFKRGFPKEMTDNEPFSHIYMMQNLEYFIQLRDLFDQDVSIMTVDGIYVTFRMVVKQITQLYNSVIISNFYYTKYIIEDQELERILSIRFSGQHIYSSNNILDLLLSQNIYSILANKFGNYISNPKNFEPPLNQDLYPEKTCKYRAIKQINA